MKVRFLQLARIDQQTTVLRTASRRWFRLHLPIETVHEVVRSIADEDNGEGGGANSPAVESLRELLRNEGSIAPRRANPTPHITAVTGKGPLVGALSTVADGSLRMPRVLQVEAVPDSASDFDFLLVDRTGLAESELRHLDDVCMKRGRPWAPFAMDLAAGWFGPIFDGSPGPTLADLLGRLATTAESRPWLDGRPVLSLGEWAAPDGAELSWLLATIAVEVERYLHGEDDRLRWRELELELANLGGARHLIFPLPISVDGDAGRLDFSCAFDDLVDRRGGIVTRLVRLDHHASIPRQLITVHAHVGNMRRVSPWFTDPVAAGTSFRSEETARHAAIGEAIERYSGDIVREDLLCYESWEELSARGEDAVDPESLVMFSSAQYAEPGFPFVPLTRDRPIHWTRGWSLSKDRPAWLPSSLVYGNWYAGAYRDTPRFNNTFHPGLAAGPDLPFAIAAGIQEIIERHATMVWWLNAEPLPSIIPSDALAAIWAGAPTDLGQRPRLIALDNEFGVPVLAGIVENTIDQFLTIGFAARPDPEEAALKAWAEALTLQDGARDLLRPRGGFRQAADRGEIDASHVKPWRADRRYLDSYRSDFRDVVDLMCQLQVYLDPRAIDRVRHLVEPPTAREIGSIPALKEYSVTEYQRVVESRGYEIFYADITTRDVACSGARVVRVLIPGLVPNFAAAFPYLGKGAVLESAVRLGWRGQPLDEKSINVMPLPHA
jgi:ribosomal protein S12 methylthiotransferase accessory factor